ncbi:MAG: rhamnulokinase family protein, partial [Christensenellaceae bacterium]
VNDGGFDMIGIDTWGVDFGLIGFDGQMLENPIHYRDSRTDDYKQLYQTISAEDIYWVTGVQQMQINTIYQLSSIVRHRPELLKRTKKLLFTPDFYNYLLTGVMKTEYTIASTSELLNAKKREFDFDLIKKAGIPKEIFCEIVKPGTPCGFLSDEICEELGAPKVQVMCVASHDTASAVAAVPTQDEEFIYISCGTWSLLGTELKEPCISEKALAYNFTNEGGINNTIRFLKNIMGTWLIQESRRQWIREGQEYGFGDLEQLAKKSRPFACFIDVDDDDFIKPGNIPARIQKYCEQTGQYVPQTPGEIVRCIDESLAMKYRYNIAAAQECTGIDCRKVNILGGGTKSALLCQMTANASGKDVVAGPDEATIFGNIAVQLIACKEIRDFKEAREVVKNSCELQYYTAQNTQEWDSAYECFIKIVKE